MRGVAFDEADFFSAIDRSGVRVLLIGRRALIVLGMPVLTADYDFWLHIDDIERFNAALEPLDLYPNVSPDQARSRGRYVLENDEHVDVLVSRSQSTKDGVRLAFDEAWSRRQRHDLGTATVWLPSLEDLILTKRWAMRPRDEEDVQFLEVLRKEGEQ